jgi:hypothetical protein
VWALLLLALSTPWIAWLYCLPHLHELAARWALESAQWQGALLYKAGFGLSPVAFMACSTASTFLVMVAVDLTWPGLWRSRLVVQGRWLRLVQALGSKARATASSAVRSVRRRRTLLLSKRRRRLALMWLAVLALNSVAIACVVVDLRGHRVFTQTAYVRWPPLPGSAAETYPWSTAVSVGLGCNHREKWRRRGSARTEIVYEVGFPDGTFVRLDDAMAMTGSWLDGAEAIDQAIRGGGAVFTRWRWLSRTPLHPTCLQWLRSSLSAQDQARMWQLLRIGELPAAR